ncbi:Holliday junction branch migration protein RuvA [bacterium]|nr:Holliday junction branch migration protein RuvA [bacterium]
MIASLHGTVADIPAEGLVYLSCGPVTLELHMPASQALRLHSGETLRLHTHFHFSSSADMLRLYAFQRSDERDLFVMLLSASGVGPRVALSLMDLGFGGLVRAIIDADEKTLSSATGVGRKLAQKIGVELSDKVAKRFGQHAGEASGTGRPAQDDNTEQAIEAICALGFTRAQAEDSLSSALADGEAETAVLVRRMLAWLSRN